MKYRPLCTIYLTDARSQLEEIGVRKEHPLLVIEPPVIGDTTMDHESSCDESEGEEAIEKPLQTRRRRSTSLSLKDDASFAFIQQDGALGKTETCRREETWSCSSSDDLSLELAKQPSRTATAKQAPKYDMEDEIDSIDSSIEEQVAVKPFQLVTSKLAPPKRKRPPPAPKPTVDRHPLEDTDDEDDVPFVASSNKRRMKKRLPSVVDVTLVHSPVNSLLDSQTQQADFDDDMHDGNDHNSMAMDDDDVEYSIGDDIVMNDAQFSFQQIKVDTASPDTSDKDQEMEIVEHVLDVSGTSQGIAPVVMSPKKRVVKEYLQVDPRVIATIMQGLEYSQSRKRIAAYPHNHYLILPCAATAAARASFWELGPTRGLATESILDAMLGRGGMQRILLGLAQLSEIQRPESSTARTDSRDAHMSEVGEAKDGRERCGTQSVSRVSSQNEDQRLALFNDNGNAPEKMASHQDRGNESEATRLQAGSSSSTGTESRTVTDTISSESCRRSPPASSRALVVPVNRSVAIPPVWLDVCNAIMVLHRDNPEEFATLVSSFRSPGLNQTVSQPVPANANRVKRAVGTSVQDETPRSKKGQHPRVVSDEKRKSGAAKVKNSPPDTSLPPATHKHRSEQEKLDRQERKRQRKEKRERKKQKKAERKERKRKAREQNKAAEQLASVEPRRASSHPNDVSKQRVAIDMSVSKDQELQNASIADPGPKLKRQRTEETRPTAPKPKVPARTDVVRLQESVSHQPAVRRSDSLTAPAVDPSSNMLGKRTTLYDDEGANVDPYSERAKRDVIVEDEVVVVSDGARSRRTKRRKKDTNGNHSSSDVRCKPSKEAVPMENKVPNANDVHRESKNLPPTSTSLGVKGNLDLEKHKGCNRDNCRDSDAPRYIHNGTRNRQDETTDLGDAVTAPESEGTSRREHQQEPPPRLALCSESFFEQWTDTVSLLASGRWYQSVSQSQAPEDDETLGPKIQLVDTPLLEEGGVDIELPGHAIIVHRLSSWEEAEVANVAAKQLVRLTVLEAYKSIDVIICADTDITPSLASAMAFIQNAVLSQGLSCSCSPSFQVTGPRLLAPVVASRVLSTPSQGIPTGSFIDESIITDTRVQERARFLRSMAPSLSVCGALQCLMCASEGDQNEQDPTSGAFQRLISSKSTIDPKLFRHNVLFQVNASAFRQLTMAINVPFV